jgi:hypothetical protein
LDRIEAIRQAGKPLPHSIPTMSFPSFRAIHADVLKGMISYRGGFSECEHRHASNGQQPGNSSLTGLIRLAKGKIQAAARRGTKKKPHL